MPPPEAASGVWNRKSFADLFARSSALVEFQSKVKSHSQFKGELAVFFDTEDINSLHAVFNYA